MHPTINQQGISAYTMGSSVVCTRLVSSCACASHHIMLHPAMVSRRAGILAIAGYWLFLLLHGNTILLSFACSSPAGGMLFGVSGLLLLLLLFCCAVCVLCVCGWVGLGWRLLGVVWGLGFGVWGFGVRAHDSAAPYMRRESTRQL